MPTRLFSGHTLRVRSMSSVCTKQSSGRSVTGLYHRNAWVNRFAQFTASMVDEQDGLFDLLTQSKFDPGANYLPEVDQLFSHVPLPNDFEFSALFADIVSEAPGPILWAQLLSLEASGGQHFGPTVTESDISNLQKAAVPANTKKNTNWAMNVWTE